MPVTGARNEVKGLKALTAEVRAALAEARTNVAQEMTAFAKEIRENGALVVKKIQDERAETMAEFGEMLGNERAGDDTQG